MLPAPTSLFTTVPQLSSDLQREGLDAPAWVVRRLADRLSGGRCPRIGWHVRLIDDGLAERIRQELARRGLLAQSEQGVAHA
jgi:hypothetical protein